MNTTTKRIHAVSAALLCLAAGLATPASAQVKIDGEAFVGQPFGVGRITIDMPAELQPEPLGKDGVGLSQRDGRVLYPAIAQTPVLGLLRDVLQQPPGGPVGRALRQRPALGLLRDVLQPPQAVSICFLFRGEAPLELTVEGRRAYTVTLTPRSNPRRHRRLLTAWWRDYADSSPSGLLAKLGLLNDKPDYPPLLETYLTAQLARRLALPWPRKQQTDSGEEMLQREIGLTLGTEEVRVAMLRDRMLGAEVLRQQADQPLPEPIVPVALQIPEPAADVPVEPIARRVPPECLYARFGSYANFLWFQDTLARWGGDAQNLIAMRGLDYGTSRRIEQQLVLKQTVLARLLGDTVVADVAIVGTDLFLHEGAAFGILFQARNSLALGASIAQQRVERIAAGGVSEAKREINGRSISLLSSPDGKVRSYYAVDGDFHFVTTSKTLAERFLATADGGGLGTTEEFRHARTLMPLGRPDAAFVYLSDALLRNMVGPHYRVEMARRLQAAADIEAVQLASLAATTEGVPGETIEELIAGGLLPPQFGPRGDGSRTIIRSGEVSDSLRGHRGALLPIPDVPVTRVTAAEAAAYRQFADYYREKWGRLDPILVGVQREELPEGRERISLDLRISPMGSGLYDFLARRVGPPDTSKLAPIPGDVATAELVLANQRIFAGVRDFGPPLEVVNGRIFPAGPLRDVLVGYLGNVGQPGLLAVLDLQMFGEPDPNGYTRSPTGLWRRQLDEFTVYSLHGEVLAEVTPQLRFGQAEHPAQVRIRIDDVSATRITPLLNALGHKRTRGTSLGNLRLMHALREQLHVPTEDCRMAAEFLMDATLVCPLGGQYTFETPEGGVGRWTSTALAQGSRSPSLLSQVPDGYQTPPLNWFRGAELEATLSGNTLSGHAEVIMQLPEGN